LFSRWLSDFAYHRTSGLLQLVSPPALAQVDPADARLLACSSESGEGVGDGGEEPANWREAASEEATQGIWVLLQPQFLPIVSKYRSGSLPSNESLIETIKWMGICYLDSSIFRLKTRNIRYFLALFRAFGNYLFRARL
jgi:hypothetical protein